MKRPVLLDLFCCEGGAATGYHRAGFDVIGVDIEPQPNYPFTFHQGDALTLGRLLTWRHDFDAVHASPPCQARTTMSNRWRGLGGVADEHVNLIAPTRELLLSLGLPYIIENVPGARRDLRDPVTLSGGMFGLRVDRPRLFETNWPLSPLPRVRVENPVGVYGKLDGRRLWTRKDGTQQRAARGVDEARDVMGMPWASARGCAEAIPPAYTEHIGRALLTHVAEVAA